MTIFRIAPRCVLQGILIFALACAAATQRPVTLVLSGGGARGLAQIGVIKALDEAGIKPRLIVATSMGAIIGSLYAAGYCPDSIAAFSRMVDWGNIYANAVKRNTLLVSQKDNAVNYLVELRFDRNLNIVLPNSISFGQSFYDYLVPRLAPAQVRASSSFDSLTIPLRIIATDILTCKSVVVSKGNLSTAIRASCGIPLAFSPVTIDTMLLMDGGMTANIPVEPALAIHPSDYVIAVDVTSSLWDKEELSNPVRLVDQIVSIGIRKQKSVEHQLASILISPELGDYRNTNFSNIDSLITIGYTAAKKLIDLIKSDVNKPQPTATNETPSAAMIKTPIRWIGTPLDIAAQLNRGIDSVAVNKALSVQALRLIIQKFFSLRDLPFAKTQYITAEQNETAIQIDPGIVKKIVFEGNTVTSSRVFASAIPIKQGDTLKNGTPAAIISTLLATELFKNVNVEFDSLGIVRIMVEEKEFWRARIGVRYDEYHLGEGFVQPGYSNVFGLGITALLHLQYGLRREKYAFEFFGDHLFSSLFANKFQLEAYVSREKIISTKESPVDTTFAEYTTVINEQSLQRAGLLFLTGAQIGKSAMIDGGIRVERFRHSSSDQSLLRDPFNNFELGMQYLMLRTTIDNLDKFPFPEKGQKHYICMGGAHDILGGSSRFMKFEASTSSYFTWNKIHTFFPQIQLIWASDTLPDAERAFLGGAVPEEKYKEIGVYDYLPFYGMRPRALPGDVVFLIHGNYRLKFHKKLFFTTSIDWGYGWQWGKNWAWNTHTISNLNGAYKEFLEYAPVGLGIGVAYESIVGPIRLTWGRLLVNHLAPQLNIPTENQVYFSIGHDF